MDEIGKVSGSWIGRNSAYKSVVLMDASSSDLNGKKLYVKVVKAFRTYLEGKLVD